MVVARLLWGLGGLSCSNIYITKTKSNFNMIWYIVCADLQQIRSVQAIHPDLVTLLRPISAGYNYNVSIV